MKLMLLSFKAANMSFIRAQEKRKQCQPGSNLDENSVEAVKQPKNTIIKIDNYYHILVTVSYKKQ